MELNVLGTSRGRRISFDNLSLQSIYKDRLPICIEKKNDRVRLVKSRVIPPEYAHWYSNLPSATNIRGSLPEPNVDEENTDD